MHLFGMDRGGGVLLQLPRRLAVEAAVADGCSACVIVMLGLLQLMLGLR